MTELRDSSFSEDFLNDLAHMRSALQQAGIQVSDAKICRAWSMYSEDLCASWLRMPENDTLLLKILLDYLRDVASLETTHWNAILTKPDDTGGLNSLAIPRVLMEYTGWQDGMMLTIIQDEFGQLIIRPSTNLLDVRCEKN